MLSYLEYRQAPLVSFTRRLLMNALAKFYACIEEMRKIDPEMQAHTINIFVMVCLNPGITMKDLGSAWASLKRPCLET